MSVSTGEKERKEELHSAVRFVASNLLDEVVNERYGMSKHHPPEDVPLAFVNAFEELIMDAHSLGLSEGEAKGWERGIEAARDELEKLRATEHGVFDAPDMTTAAFAERGWNKFRRAALSRLSALLGRPNN